MEESSRINKISFNIIKISGTLIIISLPFTLIDNGIMLSISLTLFVLSIASYLLTNRTMSNTLKKHVEETDTRFGIAIVSIVIGSIAVIACLTCLWLRVLKI